MTDPKQETLTEKIHKKYGITPTEITEEQRASNLLWKQKILSAYVGIDSTTLSLSLIEKIRRANQAGQSGNHLEQMKLILTMEKDLRCLLFRCEDKVMEKGQELRKKLDNK